MTKIRWNYKHADEVKEEVEGEAGKLVLRALEVQEKEEEEVYELISRKNYVWSNAHIKANVKLSLFFTKH